MAMEVAKSQAVASAAPHNSMDASGEPAAAEKAAATDDEVRLTISYFHGPLGRYTPSTF